MEIDLADSIIRKILSFHHRSCLLEKKSNSNSNDDPKVRLENDSYILMVKEKILLGDMEWLNDNVMGKI